MTEIHAEILVRFVRKRPENMGEEGSKEIHDFVLDTARDLVKNAKTMTLSHGDDVITTIIEV